MQTVWTEIRLYPDKTAPYEAFGTGSTLLAFERADNKTDWFSVLHLSGFQYCIFMKLSKCAKIRNQNNQVSHLTKDTNGKVTNSQLDTTNESQEVSPFPACNHKAHINRRTQRHSKHKTVKTKKIHKRSTVLEWSVKYFTGGLKPVSWCQPHP